jgi:hypothetical protein
MGRWSVRSAVLIGSPLLMAVSSVLHPRAPFGRAGMLEFLRPRLSLWMGVHLVQLFLLLLLGLALFLLTEGLSGRAATLSRLATAVFLVFYGAFDSVVGVGTGMLARVVEAQPPIDASLAAEIVDRFWLARLGTPIGPLILVACLSWLVAATSAALALRARGAPRSAVVLLVVAGIFFGIDHPWPTGTIGMLALLAATIVLLRHGLPSAALAPRQAGIA